VFPYDQRKLAALHARALREADVVASVAHTLHEQALRERPDALYMPNAVEAGRFDREPELNPALVDPEFSTVLAAGRPIAGYYGALASWFDYALIADIARQRPDWSFVLIGPDYDGSLARFKLDHLPNVYCLGPRPYAALPGYLHRFAVAMIPFRINEITLATSPLKLYEYFAAARPVISTPLPECAAFKEVRIVRDAGELSAALDAAVKDAKKPEFAARLAELAAQNTWQARARGTMHAVEQAMEKCKVGPLSPNAHALMQRFASLENPGNRRFFRALAVHLASIRDDPCLPMYFEFALSANERGRKAAALIDSILPLAGKRALDVGCAYGGFVVALDERGALPTGFDIDPQLLALAEHNFRDVGKRLPVYRADVTNPDDVARFRDTFDVICCNDVIEHVSDPAVAIRHIASMLRPGGLAYFEIPNRDAVGAVVSDGHYQLFGITQLEREAAARYFAEHAPGIPYGVEYYLRLPEYQALFEAAGLVMALMPDAAAIQPLPAVRDALASLRKALPSKLESVPAPLRDEIREAVVRYLDEAERKPEPDAQRAYIERYGIGFWRIIARKPGAGAPARSDVAAQQLDHVAPG
jgi:2-polyprenyl-3-methyl-5-hydroxy-6-metoxy-1,4-benzoquinol methylase